MRVPLVLALFAIAAYAGELSPGSASERHTQYAAYSEYIYEYKGQILSGLPEVSREYAGLRLKCNVKLQIHSQNRFLMQLKDVQLCKIQRELDNPSEQQEPLPEECQEDRYIQEIKQELEKRIEFYWTKGQINQISTLRSDPDYSVNIKRGVLELLQVNLEGGSDSKHLAKTYHQDQYYRIMEQGISGECESIYSVKVHVSEAERIGNEVIGPRDGLNVTKVRNYENCLDRPSRNNIFMLKGVICKDCKTNEEGKLLTQLGQIRYNITGNRKLFLIDSVVANGKHVFEPFGEQRGQAVTFVNQTLVIQQINKIPTAADPEYLRNLDQTDSKEQTEGLKYVFPEEKPRETIRAETHNIECQAMPQDHGLHEQVEQLLNNIANGVSEFITEESLDQLQLLTQKLRELSRDELCHCMNYFGQDLVNDAELNEKRRKILEDLLPLLGSLHSVEILYRRIESRRITGYRAAELVSTLAFHPSPDDQILDTVLELCMSAAVNEDEQLKQTCWLTFGSLVNSACKDEDRQRCPQIKEDRYMKALVAGTDRQRPEEERRMCLKALGNAGIHYKNNSYNLLQDIQRIVEDNDQVDLVNRNPEIKAQAIYSLRRISSKRPEEIRTILLPILRDQSNHHEVRIAAYVIMMDTQPDHLFIQMLGQLLQREKSRQVGNFIYSYLKGLAESRIPCKKNVTQGVKEAMKIAKKWENGLQYSKSYHWKQVLLKKKISSAINVNWISAPESSFGIGGSSKVSFNVLGRNFNALEFGLRSEHMEELVQRLVFKVKGVYPPINQKFKDEKNKAQGLTSREILMGEQINELSDLVKRIDSEVNVTERHPSDERMRASVYIKAFGQELRYWSLNESVIEEILAGNNKDLRDYETLFRANQPQIKYQKAFTLGDGWQQWPTTMGLPIHLNLSNSVLMALDATGKAVMEPSLQQVLASEEIKAKDIEITGTLNPRMAMLTRGKLGVSLNNNLKAGVALEAVVNTSVLINGTIKINVQQLKIESKFTPPQHNHTVVSLRSKPYTYSISGEPMPKKYQPKSKVHMTMMTQEQIRESSNQENKRVINDNKAHVMKKQVGSQTVIAELSSAVTRDSRSRRSSNILLSGPANVSLVVLPGINRPEEIQLVGVISDWKVTPEQYEAHVRRSSIRQYIEPDSQSSSESGSRSFSSAETFQDVELPGDFLSSKELHLPTALPASLEERREKQMFDWETAHWTDEDRRVMPMTAINSVMGQQQQEQEQHEQPQQGCSEERFIPLKRIYLNITAIGQQPQNELLIAITTDTKDYRYKALTLDLIYDVARSEEEIRQEVEHRQMLKRLRDDPLNTNAEQLRTLEELDEQRQLQRNEQRSVLCMQGEVEYSTSFKEKRQGQLLPKALSDDTKVKYRMGVQYGDTCENDKKVQILARIEKSKEQLINEKRAELGQKTDEERQCEEDITRGDKYSQSCKRISEDRQSLRSLHLNITTKVGRVERQMRSMFGDVVLRLMGKVGKVQKEEALNQQNQFSISIDQGRNRDTLNMSVKAPLKNVKFQTCQLPIKLPALNAPMKSPIESFLDDNVLGKAEPRCKINSLDKVITFDNVTYDYELSKCHHILAKDCSPTEQFLVLGRKQEQGRPEKETIIHLAGHKIEFKPDMQGDLQVYVDDVNQQMQYMDELVMRQDGTMQKENVRACERRTLMDVIRPDITDNGITSSEIYRILTHKERHQTPRPAGQSTPRPASLSASHGIDSGSKSGKSMSFSMSNSDSSEEVMMRVTEREMWDHMKEIMMMTFEGHEQQEVMEMLGIQDQIRTEDGYLIDLEEPSHRKLLKIFRTSRSVFLYDYRLGLFVATCGQNIKVEISRQMQDKVCGLCGHFDGEITKELEGPSKEIYSDPKQFALTYQLQSVPQECAQECVPRATIEKQDLYVENVDSTCYSKVLVPRCRDNCRPVETRRVKTEFVCIGRDSGLKSQLDVSIDTHRPHEVVRALGSKSPSFIEEIEVHTRCQQ